jgi:hypothetical protein
VFNESRGADNRVARAFVQTMTAVLLAARATRPICKPQRARPNVPSLCSHAHRKSARVLDSNLVGGSASERVFSHHLVVRLAPTPGVLQQFHALVAAAVLVLRCAGGGLGGAWRSGVCSWAHRCSIESNIRKSTSRNILTPTQI